MFLNIARVLLILIALVDLFMWMAAIASGHKLPWETHLAFAATLVVLILICGIVIWLRQRTIKNREGYLDEMLS